MENGELHIERHTPRAMFEQFLEIDEDVLEIEFMQGYMWFKVLFNLRKSIILGFLLPNQEEEEEEEWIPLVREKLGDFCYCCGKLTHTNCNCQDVQLIVIV